MRIALFTDGISPIQMGGMQRHSFLLVKYLALNGVSIDLFTIRSLNINEPQVLDEFPVEARHNIRVHLVDFIDNKRFPGHYLLASYQFSNALLESYLKVDRPNFIYTKGFTGWALLKARRRNKNNFPKIGVKFHGMNMFQTQPNLRGNIEKYLFRFITKWIMKQSDFVFSYGAKISDIIEGQGISREKIIGIPSGIEEDWLITHAKLSPEGVVRFLFVGRYDRVKGLPELYRAISLVKTIYCEFHFVGPIPEEKRLQSSNCVYHGSITNPNMLKLAYDQCHFLICPSHSEGMPNVILEAMSRGLPVIATDTGAIKMLVNEHTGYLLSHPKPNMILKLIERCAVMPKERYSELSRCCVDHVSKEFTWDQIALKTIEQIKVVDQF